MVRRFNDLQQRQARTPRRTIWLSLAHKQAGPGKILDLLGHALQCPISASDLRLRAFNHIIAMLLEQATRMGIVGIVVDHLERAAPDTLEYLTDLALLTDPSRRAALSVGEHVMVAPPIALVFIGTMSPKTLAHCASNLSSAIGPLGAKIDAMTTADEISSAIKLAVPALWEARGPVSDSICEKLLQYTDGLASGLRPIVSQTALLAGLRPSHSLESLIVSALDDFTTEPPPPGDNGAANFAKVGPREPRPVASGAQPQNKPRGGRAHRAIKTRANALEAADKMKRRGLVAD
jgi:hypothetical protein